MRGKLEQQKNNNNIATPTSSLSGSHWCHHRNGYRKECEAQFELKIVVISTVVRSVAIFIVRIRKFPFSSDYDYDVYQLIRTVSR